MAGGENQVTLKESFFGSLDVLSLFIYVLYCQSKVDNLYLMQEVFVVAELRRVPDQNVVQLDVVERVACVVDQLDLLQQLQANLVTAGRREGLVTREQVALQGLSQLFLNDVGPDLVVKGLHHLVLAQLGEVLDVPELSVEDEGLALGVGLNELDLLLFRFLTNLLERLELRVRHRVIL